MLLLRTFQALAFGLRVGAFVGCWAVQRRCNIVTDVENPDPAKVPAKAAARHRGAATPGVYAMETTTHGGGKCKCKCK